MKKYLKGHVYYLTLLLVSSLIICLMYFFNILKPNIYTNLLYIFSILSSFIGYYIFSKNINKKGIITGSIFFFSTSFIMLLTAYIINGKLNISSYIYYLIILLSCLLAGIISKNKKAINELHPLE